MTDLELTDKRVEKLEDEINKLKLAHKLFLLKIYYIALPVLFLLAYITYGRLR